MVNVDFLVVAYFVGMFVDWVFQWNWQAFNKSKWSKQDNKILSISAVTSHSFIYAVFTTVSTLYLIRDYVKSQPYHKLSWKQFKLPK